MKNKKNRAIPPQQPVLKKQAKSPLNSQPKLLARNKKAFFNYTVLDSLEAGIILSGSEIKSARLSGINLSGSYARITATGQVLLLNMHIKPYLHANKVFSENEEQTRRTCHLLLNKKEIVRLSRQLETKGRTLVPLEVYLKNQWLKVRLAVCQGKKFYDKRATAKQKQGKKDIERVMKHRHLHH